MLKCAVVGCGGLGKTHLRSLVELEKSRGDFKVVALCDVEPSQFTAAVQINIGDVGASDVSAYRLYNDVDEMLEKEELDFCVTALPTYEHARIGVKILNKGVHLFSEKPMALTLEECDDMLRAAKKNNCKLMIGQCIRYANEFLYLKELMESGKYGKLVHIRFNRMSATPRWSWQHWMEDVNKSGGAALDLHVHDTDFVNFLFGIPDSVVSFATHDKTGFDSIHTTYVYDDRDALIMATGDWGLTKYPFNQYCLMNLEHATVILDRGVITVYPEEGAAFSPEVALNNTKQSEEGEFIDCILQNKESAVNPASDSRNSIMIALAEIESAKKKGEKVFLKK